MLQKASVKYRTSSSVATREFFKCLDTNSRSVERAWLTGVSRNVEKFRAKVAVANGEDLDSSADPLYPLTVRHICKALGFAEARLFPEAMARKVAILAGMLSVGRAGELSELVTGLMEWDADMQCVVGKNFQKKVSSFKPILFMVGRSPEQDFFTAFGDFLATALRTPPTGPEKKNY